MVQIARVALHSNLAFHIALRRIFGIGPTTSLQISEACGISAELKVGARRHWWGGHARTAAWSLLTLRPACTPCQPPTAASKHAVCHIVTS